MRGENDARLRCDVSCLSLLERKSGQHAFSDRVSAWRMEVNQDPIRPCAGTEDDKWDKIGFITATPGRPWA
jgi:hypothetical protein